MISSVIQNAINNAQTSRVLWQGIVSMREKGAEYLHPSLFEQTEDGKKSYEHRLENAALKNKYKYTVNYILGQIFRKPLQFIYEDIKEEVIKYFESFKEDVDNKGNDYNVFLKESLKNALIDGVSYAIVDTPNFDVSDDKKKIIFDKNIYANTVDNIKKLNLRPYWINIELKNVISVKVEIINGKKEITEFIYQESILQEDNNGFKTKIYKYTKNNIEIYNQEQGNTVLERTKVNKFGFIPVSIFLCGEKINEYTALPTLSDLAELNVAYYNSYSEHQCLMRYVRNPLWHGKGIESVDENGDRKDIILGPNAVLIGNENSDLKSVGVDSASVVQSMEDLARQEKAMDEYTSSLITSQNMTAEQVDMISKGADNQIKNWATTFKNFIEDLLCNTSIIAGYNKDRLENNYPQIVVNNEFTKPFDYQQASLLQDMVSQKQLSKRTFLLTLKGMSIFDEDFNVDEELEEISKEDTDSFKGVPEEG